MLQKNAWPVLEFDDSPSAKLNPTHFAVAQFRHFAYGALIYGGDDLTGEDWNGRSWRSREGIRYDLVQLCADLVSEI